MVLPQVAKGEPHIPAHNAERTAINDIAAGIDSLTALVGELAQDFASLADQPGPAGKTLLTGLFDIPQSGDISQTFYLPEAVTKIFPPVLEADVPPTGSPLTVEVEVDKGSGFSSVLGAPVTLSPNETWKVGGDPVSQIAPAGSKMRFKVVSAPVTSVSALTRNNNVGTYNSAAASVTNITMTKPTGAANGDLLIAFIGRQGPTLTLPAGWTVLSEVQSDATTVQARLTVAYAINSDTLGMTVQQSSGSPIIAHVLSFTGFDRNVPISTPVNHGQNNEGKVITLSPYTVGKDATVEPDELVLWAALSRYGAADDARVHTWTGATPAADAGTSRGSTNTDLHLSVASNGTPVQKDGTVLSGVTVGDPAGSDFTSWCTVVLGIRRGLSAGSAGRLSVQIMVR